jgi:aldose 1-epimerase
MTQQTLRTDELELVVDAARGGSIMAFRQRGFDLMRPWDGVTEDPRAYASFPLVPFSGRIDHARFRFNGRSYTLAANFPPEPHAIHGDGWTSPWLLPHQPLLFSPSRAIWEYSSKMGGKVDIQD